MKTILITGSQGFIGSYLCKDFLEAGYRVIGIDDYSKYGKVSRPHDNHENFIFLEIDYVVAVAAMIGGITYFHKYAYDLLANNERILASTFDLAIELFKKYKLKRIVVLSSSMVFERTEIYPTPEAEIENCPPPMSTYGFQSFFDIIINKISKGQDPLHILGKGDQIRCYTNGRDIARGIRMALESNKAINEDFNISTPTATSVLDLAKLVWSKLNPDKEFSFVSDTPYKYDVQKRIPDVSKAKEFFNFESKISLEESIDEVINWINNKGDNNET